MSSTATLVQAAAAVSYGQVFSTTVYLALLAGFVLFFRPLLVGIGRALYLTVPRAAARPSWPRAAPWTRRWRSSASSPAWIRSTPPKYARWASATDYYRTSP